MYTEVFSLDFYMYSSGKTHACNVKDMYMYIRVYIVYIRIYVHVQQFEHSDRYLVNKRRLVSSIMHTVGLDSSHKNPV